MKPISPHDPLDDLIAAALHGELTPEERAQFESRLSTDPAAHAAYQEAQAMHDLLEKNYQSAQPDPAFEQRMVSGVRRKIQSAAHRETAWESLVALWRGLKNILGRRSLWTYGGVCSVVLVLFLAFAIYSGNQVKGVFTTITSQLAMAGQASPASSAYATDDFQRAQAPISSPPRPNPALLAALDRREAHWQDQLKANPSNQVAAQQLARVEAQKKRYDVVDQNNLRQVIEKQGIDYVTTAQKGITLSGYVDTSYTEQFGGKGTGFGVNGVKVKTATYTTGGTTVNAGTLTMGATAAEPSDQTTPQGGTIRGSGFMPPGNSQSPRALPVEADVTSAPPAAPAMVAANNTASAWNEDGQRKEAEAAKSENAAPTAPAAVDARKLIRNAQLDLEVKSFQAAMDRITALTKSAGGYVDTSNSQRGGNGKLQGTVVVKVLPENLDAFLLQLRDLGEVKNQSVSTDDVTKDYFDTQARLDNSRRMEAQLQDLLKHENGKVSDLLAVERELGRVRGEIEQMQGQLKLYDFQVEYATVTMNLTEKDLNQTAAYLLKEQDDFSLFATDVEGTFQKARATADDFKAQILTANLNHNSGSDVSAELVVMVAPDQIEPFLAQVRSLGRVANFTRQTQRIAQDGGDSDHPADQTLTEKDKVQVHLAIRSDDETRKQVALTVVTKAVDDALNQAKTAALANAGVEILNSSLNKTPEGQSTAQLTVRVPGKDYSSVIAAFRALGRTASLSIQRNDDSGPGANGDDAPVIVSLALTDDDTPLQQTEMSVLAADVDTQAQQIKKDAATAGVEVKASSFERQPDGTELAQMTFRLPMSKYPAFLESVKNLGKVESLSVHRDDRPDQTIIDDTAPAEISLQLHNQRDLVADDSGLWATLRQTFGEGAGALFTSVRVIGVVLAFLAPWVFTLVLLAWVGRRIYIWRKK